MVKLNRVGALLGTLPYVTALTDVTGFGLLGHLTEMCEGSGLQAVVEFERCSEYRCWTPTLLRNQSRVVPTATGIATALKLVR